MWHKNKGRSTAITSQILPLVRPEFSLIIEMTGHFFSSTTGKEFVRDTLKMLEKVQTIFKRMPRFFTDDNLITTLGSVQIQLHHEILKIKYNDHKLN